MLKCAGKMIQTRMIAPALARGMFCLAFANSDLFHLAPAAFGEQFQAIENAFHLMFPNASNISTFLYFKRAEIQIDRSKSHFKWLKPIKMSVQLSASYLDTQNTRLRA